MRNPTHSCLWSEARVLARLQEMSDESVVPNGKSYGKVMEAAAKAKLHRSCRKKQPKEAAERSSLLISDSVPHSLLVSLQHNTTPSCRGIRQAPASLQLRNAWVQDRGFKLMGHSHSCLWLHKAFQPLSRGVVFPRFP